MFANLIWAGGMAIAASALIVSWPFWDKEPSTRFTWVIWRVFRITSVALVLFLLVSTAVIVLRGKEALAQSAASIGEMAAVYGVSLGGAVLFVEIRARMKRRSE